MLYVFGRHTNLWYKYVRRDFWEKNMWIELGEVKSDKSIYKEPIRRLYDRSNIIQESIDSFMGSEGR